MPRVQDRPWQSSWWNEQRWSWNSPAEAGRAWWQSWWQRADWEHDVRDDVTAACAEETWNTGTSPAEGGWSRGSQQRWRRRSDAWEQHEDTWERRAAYKDRMHQASKSASVTTCAAHHPLAPVHCSHLRGNQACKSCSKHRLSIRPNNLTCKLTGAGQRHGSTAYSPADAAREDLNQHKHAVQQKHITCWGSRDKSGRNHNVSVTLNACNADMPNRSGSCNKYIKARERSEEGQDGFTLTVEVPLAWDHEFTGMAWLPSGEMSSLPQLPGPGCDWRPQAGDSQQTQKATSCFSGSPEIIDQTHYQTSRGGRGPEPARGHRRDGDFVRRQRGRPRGLPTRHSKTHIASEEALSSHSIGAASWLKQPVQHSNSEGTATSTQHAALGSKPAAGRRSKNKRRWHRRCGCGHRSTGSCSRWCRRGSWPTGQRHYAARTPRSCPSRAAGAGGRTARSGGGADKTADCRPRCRRGEEGMHSESHTVTDAMSTEPEDEELARAPSQSYPSSQEAASQPKAPRRIPQA